jgi:hypothetical protein
MVDEFDALEIDTDELIWRHYFHRWF